MDLDSPSRHSGSSWISEPLASSARLPQSVVVTMPMPATAAATAASLVDTVSRQLIGADTLRPSFWKDQVPSLDPTGPTMAAWETRSAGVAGVPAAFRYVGDAAIRRWVRPIVRTMALESASTPSRIAMSTPSLTVSCR